MITNDLSSVTLEDLLKEVNSRQKLRADDLEIGAKLTIHSSVDEILQSPMGDVFLKKVTTMNGWSFEVLAVNLPYIVVKVLSTDTNKTIGSLLGTLPYIDSSITLDIRNHNFIKVSDDYIQALQGGKILSESNVEEVRYKPVEQ